MAQTVKNQSTTNLEINSCKWLNRNELKYYTKNFIHSGMKKPLYWYRVMLSKKEKLNIIKLNLPKSTKIPSIFIAGAADWGTYQKPGDFEKMTSCFLKNYFGTIMINDAGHWVQQEQPENTFKAIINFYNKI